MSRLKQIRKQKKLFLHEVAEKVGVTPQTVQQMERHGIKTASTAKRYAAALGVSWQEIIEA